jgi:hypothetical protein
VVESTGFESARVALEVDRDGTGSTLRARDVNRDCVTENDRQHATLREYLRISAANIREVARVSGGCSRLSCAWPIRSIFRRGRCWVRTDMLANNGLARRRRS